MKFGKEFTLQMVVEWQEAYMNYNHLKSILKGISKIRQTSRPLPVSADSSPTRRVLYRAFSGLTSPYAGLKDGISNVKDTDDEVTVVSALQHEGEEEGDSEGVYQTTFLGSLEGGGGEYELLFFRTLDDEFNKVVKFYKVMVKEVMEEAEKLNKQMDALLALRFNTYHPDATASFLTSSSYSVNVRTTVSEMSHLDVIEETEMNLEGNSDAVVDLTTSDLKRSHDQAKGDNDNRLASLEVLNRVKIDVAQPTLVSKVKNVWKCSQSDFAFSEKLGNVERLLKEAFIECHNKLCLLKHYRFLNQLAFSKIMKKYDKITSSKASKVYLQMVEKSYFGYSDEVVKLIERVESTFVKHFFNGNRQRGMRILRPKIKREKHRVTFFLGCFWGCSVALTVAIILTIHAKDLLSSEGRNQYMETMFPPYSLFGFIVLHMLMYSGNIYYWKRFRVNYSFIFGVKRGTELGFREVLLFSSGLTLLTLAAILSNLEMDIDLRTKSYNPLTELIPCGLVIAVLLIMFCPLSIFYRTNRFFFIRCIWHCACAPLYKVTLPDFFLADQLTSQVQSFRSLEFYVCYYTWGDYKKRSNSCGQSHVYQIIAIIVGIIPYLIRLLQCLRRVFEEKDSTQALNGLKYFSTILAVAMRTYYDQRRGMSLRIIAAVTSGVATIFNTYWDLVMDWGLLCRGSKNPWLRDKLLVPNKFVYFAAMVLNVLLRLAWMQTVLDIDKAHFLHRNGLIAVVASLEIIRRGLWNFFRLENEHLNNVGKYRACKSVPLPFSYEDDDKDQ